MKYAFFSVPAHGGEAVKELNAFCSSHRVLGIDKHFVVDGQASYWAFCVSCMERQSGAAQTTARVDDKEVLSVVRGGSPINNARNARSAFRNRNTPDNRNDTIGFRFSRVQCAPDGRIDQPDIQSPGTSLPRAKSEWPPACW